MSLNMSWRTYPEKEPQEGMSCIVCVSGRDANGEIYDRDVVADKATIMEEGKWFVKGYASKGLTVHAWMPFPAPYIPGKWEKVENALGYELTEQQKQMITEGCGIDRRHGKTTAYALRMLLRDKPFMTSDKIPTCVNLSVTSYEKKEFLFRTVVKLYKKLHEAGVDIYDLKEICENLPMREREILLNEHRKENPELYGWHGKSNCKAE